MCISKRIAAVLVATLLLSGLTACAAKRADETNPPEQTNTTASDIHICASSDPYIGMSKETFYEDYSPACCYQDALHRSKHGLLSGSMEVPGQYAEEAKNRPMQGGSYVRNTDSYYLDNGNTYVVVDDSGDEVMRIYPGGGEYSSKKNANPTPYVPTAYADFSQQQLSNAA